MDANKIQQEGKEFAEKLSSADQIDFDYAINQYFEDHAQYITDAVRVAGVSKIKKLFTLASNVKAEGKVVGQPRYNSHHQTLSFKTTSTYVSPTLPAIVPLHARLSGLKTTRSWTVVAHLAPNNDDQGDGGVKGQKLFVTKLEASSPTYGFIPLGLLRPLTTLVLLFAASAIAFTQKHKSDNPIQFVLAAVAAVWSAMWETLVAESSRRQAQAEQWRDKKGPQLRQLYDQAVNTATKVQGDLEARAKAAGVAVDDYKTRAAQAVADLSENVEARAKAAGVPVDEYRKQAESIIADLRKRAGEAGERVQDTAKETVDQAGEVAKAQKNKAEKPKDKVGKTNRDSGINNGESNATANGNKDQNGGGGAEFVVGSDQPAKSHEEIQAEFDQVPHTPLGGHDPTAANAPTYALAAQI